MTAASRSPATGAARGRSSRIPNRPATTLGSLDPASLSYSRSPWRCLGRHRPSLRHHPSGRTPTLQPICWTARQAQDRNRYQPWALRRPGDSGARALRLRRGTPGAQRPPACLAESQGSQGALIDGGGRTSAARPGAAPRSRWVSGATLDGPEISRRHNCPWPPRGER
jgi:hypothetical protein